MSQVLNQREAIINVFDVKHQVVILNGGLEQTLMDTPSDTLTLARRTPHDLVAQSVELEFQAHLDIKLHRGLVQHNVVRCQSKVVHQIWRFDGIHWVVPNEAAMLVKACHADERLLQQVVVKIEKLACRSSLASVRCLLGACLACHRPR